MTHDDNKVFIWNAHTEVGVRITAVFGVDYDLKISPQRAVELAHALLTASLAAVNESIRLEDSAP